MSKFRIGSVALFVLGIAALFIIVAALVLAVPALSQGPALPPGEYDVEAGQYVFNVPELAPTPTPEPPAHSNVDNHPVSASIAHTHNEQDLLENIFGPPGAWHNGNSISYPWQTWHGLDADPLGPSSGVMENDIKHEGYKWLATDLGDACPEDYAIGTYSENCITAFRILTHTVGGVTGAMVRLHGYSIEVRICTPDLTTCGIMRTGGHADFGPLSIRHKPVSFTHIPLPNDGQDFAAHEKRKAPYKHHTSIDAGFTYSWHNDSVFGWNQMAAFSFVVFDDWQGIDPSDPLRVDLFCPDFQCDMNHSLFVVYHVSINSPHTGTTQLVDEIDGVIDGVMNFSGFTDRQGFLVPDCSPLGPDCIPIVLENVPVGMAMFKEKALIGKATEFDLSPPGEFWIESPN